MTKKSYGIVPDSPDSYEMDCNVLLDWFITTSDPNATQKKIADDTGVPFHRVKYFLTPTISSHSPVLYDQLLYWRNRNHYIYVRLLESLDFDDRPFRNRSLFPFFVECASKRGLRVVYTGKKKRKGRILIFDFNQPRIIDSIVVDDIE